MDNLLTPLPQAHGAEQFTALLSTPGVRIERIVSQGQSSPEHDWYDQDEHEWVMLVQGAAQLMFDDGRLVRLQAGDYLNIPAHQRHRVHWTDPDQVSIWLAVFYR